MSKTGWLWRLSVLLVGLFVLAACSTALAGGAEQPSNPAVDEAIKFLANEHGFDVETITVVSVEAVDWSDSCLGLGGIAESCLAAITPGYRVVLDADGAEFEVRTNADGSAVRIK